MSRRPASAVSGAPVLVGAATVIVALIAVILANRSATGLPLVETYDVRANVVDAKRLTPGVDVRIGGKRVGRLQGITARTTADGRDTYASLALRLDRGVGPLPADSTLRIRPRSIIGTKYVEIVRGASRRTIPAGGVLPRRSTSASVDLDEVIGTFDAGTRRASRRVVREAADGIAGRGAAVNAAVGRLPGVLLRAGRVTRTLADPRTDLAGLVAGADGATGALRPVLPELGRLIAATDTTLGAVASERPSLRDVLDEAPPTLGAVDAGSRELRPVLRDTARLARELRPVADELPGTSRALARAAVDGRPVLRRLPRLGTDLRTTLRSADRALRRDTTTGALRLLRPTADALDGALRHVVPLQTRCNYVGLFARNASDLIGEGDQNGAWLRLALVLPLAQTVGRAASPEPDLHLRTYPDDRCGVGNEPWAPGRVLGSPAGERRYVNPATAAPAGTPKGPDGR